MSEKTKPAFVVSIHDVSPLTQESVENMLNDLKAWGVRQASLLVIPDHHHRGHFRENSGFCSWLRQKVAAGHESVVHGYYHQRPSQTADSLRKRLITGIYTAGEGEFFDLEESAALERMQRAKREFAEEGVPATGFIAPAWLLGAGALTAARKAGFEYTTRIDTVEDLRRGDICRTQSLVYSTRALWRRKMSLLWNATLYARIAEKPLVRLGLHPPDRNFPEIWKQIRDLTARALADRDAISYQEWMERWRAA